MDKRLQAISLWLALIVEVNGESIDPCQRQTFSSTCPGEPGSQDSRSQFVLRYYRRGNECVSYPYGHCRKISEDPELYKYKEECEKNCLGKPTSILTEPNAVKVASVESEKNHGLTKATTILPRLRIFTRKFTKPEQRTTTPFAKSSTHFNKMELTSTIIPSSTTVSLAENTVATTSVMQEPRSISVTSTISHETTSSRNQNHLEAMKHAENSTQQIPNIPGRPKSKCESEHDEAMRLNGKVSPTSHEAHFIPLCTLDGDYDDVQCDLRKHICWCTEIDGSEISGTRISGDFRSPPICPPDVESSASTNESSSSLAAGLIKPIGGLSSIDSAFPPVVPVFSSFEQQSPISLSSVVGGPVARGEVTPSHSSQIDVDASEHGNSALREICGKKTEPLVDVTGQFYNCRLKPCPSTYKCVPGNGPSSVCCEKDDTELAANNHNVPTDNLCIMPKHRGDCGKYQLRFYFDSSLSECRYFFYSGCGGNQNNFKTLAECQKVCVSKSVTQAVPLPPAPVVDTLISNHNVAIPINRKQTPQTLPSLTSSIEEEDRSLNSFITHSSNSANPSNNIFNNDLSAASPSFGSPGVASPGVNENGAPQNLQTILRGQQPEFAVPPPNVDRCVHQRDPGSCSGRFTRWFWNKLAGECETFFYGGCQGNGNNFATKDECLTTCRKTIKDVCSLPGDRGHCSSAIRRWKFDSSLNTCSNFVYSGCGGNENNFATVEECQLRCVRAAIFVAPAVASNQKDVKIVQSLQSISNSNQTMRPQTLNEVVSTFEKSPDSELPQLAHESAKTLSQLISAQPVPQIAANHDDRFKQGSSPRSSSKDENQFSTDKCIQPKDPGPCDRFVARFWFNSKELKCEEFTYGGCAGNNNHFYSLLECEVHCARFFATLKPLIASPTQALPSPVVHPAIPQLLPPLQPPGLSPASSQTNFRPSSGGQPSSSQPGSYPEGPVVVLNQRSSTILSPTGEFVENQKIEAYPQALTTISPQFGLSTQTSLDSPPSQKPPSSSPPSSSSSSVLPQTVASSQIGESHRPQPPSQPHQSVITQPEPQTPYGHSHIIESDQPRCPNNQQPTLHPDGRIILCLPGRDHCPPGSSCFFSGLDYTCCPHVDDLHSDSASSTHFSSSSIIDHFEPNSFGNHPGCDPQQHGHGCGFVAPPPTIDQQRSTDHVSSNHDHSPQTSLLPGYTLDGGPRFQNLELSRHTINLNMTNNEKLLSTTTVTPKVEGITVVVQPAGYKAVPQSWRDSDQTFVAPGPVSANAKLIESNKLRKSSSNERRSQICFEPADKGTCTGSHLRWYYDQTYDQCRLFYYGGCKGNRNNFDTQIACSRHCTPALAGTCPDSSMPLGAPVPLICGSSKDAVRCPDGYYCSGGSSPVCCQTSVQYDIHKRPVSGVHDILEAPQIFPRSPGIAPYVVSSNSNAYSRIDIKSLKDSHSKITESQENELLAAPGQLIDLDQAHHFAVSSQLTGDSSSTLAKKPKIVWPQTTGFSQSIDGHTFSLTEKLDVVDKNPTSETQPIRPFVFESANVHRNSSKESDVSTLACPDGAEPIKNPGTNMPKDCDLDAAHNPMCPTGQYCHIDHENKQRFCCDISSRNGFDDSLNDQSVKKSNTLSVSNCLNGRCYRLPETSLDSDKDELLPLADVVPSSAVSKEKSSINEEPKETSSTSDFSRKKDDPIESSETPPRCSKTPSAGFECDKGRVHRNIYYYYSSSDSICKLFFYFGCGGNDNRFRSRGDCVKICKANA